MTTKNTVSTHVNSARHEDSKAIKGSDLVHLQTSVVNAPVVTHRKFGLGSLSSLSLLCSSFVITAFSLAEMSLAVLVSFLVFGGIGLMIARRFDRTSALIFLSVYSLGVIATIILYYHYIAVYGVPYFVGGSDDLMYEEFGRLVSRQLGLLDYGAIRGNIVLWSHNSVGYVYLVSLLHQFSDLFGGFHTMIPRLFNLMCLGLISVGVYKTSLLVSLRPQTSVKAALFAGLLPLMVYTSAHTYRDIFISVLFVWLVYLWTSAARKVELRSTFILVLFTLITIVVLFEFRKGQVFVAALIGIIGLLSQKQYTGIKGVAVILALAIAGVSCFFFASYIDQEIAGFLLQADRYSVYRVDVTGGGLSAVVFNTPPPMGYVLRVAYALISPLPALSSRLYEVWLSVGTIIQFFFIPFLFIGIVLSIRDRFRWVLIGAFVMLFVGMAMFTFAGRHIVQWLPFAIILASIGYERYQSYCTTIFGSMGLLGMAMAITYVLIK